MEKKTTQQTERQVKLPEKGPVLKDVAVDWIFQELNKEPEVKKDEAKK